MWSRIFASFANGVSHLKVQMYVAVVEGILYIPLAYVLAKSFGVAGVALALAFVSLLPASILFIDYKKFLKSVALVSGNES